MLFIKDSGYKPWFPRTRETRPFFKPENPGLGRAQNRVFSFGIFYLYFMQITHFYGQNG